MSGEVYLRKGASQHFGIGSGYDVALTFTSLAASNGRVSAQKDWGVAPRPGSYEWSCAAVWSGSPTVNGVLELYVAGAPDTNAAQIDGDIGDTDAALADVNMRRNLRYIGCVVIEVSAGSTKMVGSGSFDFSQRYMSVVAYNAGSTALSGTAADCRIDIVPVYWQGQ